MLTTLRYIWALLTLASCAAAASITGIVYLRQGETRTPFAQRAGERSLPRKWRVAPDGQDRRRRPLLSRLSWKWRTVFRR